MKQIALALICALSACRTSHGYQYPHLTARAPRLVYTEVTASWVPELDCAGGIPGYNKDGAIVLCLRSN